MPQRNEDDFFAKRPDSLPFVLSDFPFPLALTYQRLYDGLDLLTPLEAAMLLRDAFEAAFKFVAALIVADLLQAAAPKDARLNSIAKKLLGYGGVSMGTWRTLLLEASQIDKTPHPRLIPELCAVFSVPETGRGTRLYNKLEAVTTWRNATLAHGVFKNNRNEIADEVLAYLKILNDLYSALQPVFAGWRLMQTTPGNDEVDWSSGLPDEINTRANGYSHEPWPLPQNSLPLFWKHADGRSLSFGPLLNILPYQEGVNQPTHPAAYFFDRYQTDQGSPTKVTLWDYFWPQKTTRKDWPLMDGLLQLVEKEYTFERETWKEKERLADAQEAESEYDPKKSVRPDYLMNRFADYFSQSRGGYLHVMAPEGFGKSVAVRLLRAENTKVLTFHVLPGIQTGYQPFVGAINDEVKARLGVGTNESQLDVTPRQGETEKQAVRRAFSSWLSKVQAASEKEYLVLAIDGIDELLDPAVGTLSILELLPDTLPQNWFVVLTSRPNVLRPAIQNELTRLWNANPPAFAVWTLRLTDEGNEAAVRTYLKQQLPREYQDAQSVETVLESSSRTFLYAFHLTQALRSGAFSGLTRLPTANQFYPTYLQRLREEAGSRHFSQVHLRLLLFLCVARTPVTRETLIAWGMGRPGQVFWSERTVRAALHDIRDFLRTYRTPRWHDALVDDGQRRYELAHEAFRRFAERHYADELQQAHGDIVRSVLILGSTDWENLVADDAGLYAARFLAVHLEGAQNIEFIVQFLDTVNVFSQCAFALAVLVQEKKRSIIAFDIYDNLQSLFFPLPNRLDIDGIRATLSNNMGVAFDSLGRLAEAVVEYDKAIAIYERLVNIEGGAELTDGLATAYNNKGGVLQQLGRFAESVIEFDKVITICEQLVNVEGRNKLINILAMAYNNKGIAIEQLGHLVEAVVEFDKTIAIRERLVNGEGDGELANDLANAYNNKGNALQVLGRLGEAITEYNKVIAIRERLVNIEGRGELADDLANGYNNKGRVFQFLSRFTEAVIEYDKAIAIRERLVSVEGRTELNNKLASVYNNKGNTLQLSNLLFEAVNEYDKATAIYEQLIITEGRTELADGLAGTCNNKGGAFRLLDRLVEAVSEYDKAIAIYERLVNVEGRWELADDFATALMGRGKVADSLQNSQEAYGFYRKATGILHDAVQAGYFHWIPNLIKDHRICFPGYTPYVP